MATILPNNTPTEPINRSANRATQHVRGRGRGRGRGAVRRTTRGSNPQSARARGRDGHVRGRGRGRGSRGRQTTRAARSRLEDIDPSDGWRLREDNSTKIQMEQEFIEHAVGERARRFCLDAVSRGKVELSVRSLPQSRSGCIILLVDELLNKCREWLNEYVALQCEEVRCVERYEVYRYLAVLLLSHCTGLSFAKSVDILHNAGCSLLDLNRVRFISTHILAFSATDRGDVGADTWAAQRDKTPALGEFEKVAFGKSRKIFVSPTHTVATLDDDLYGTRAADNQVKTISSRKADREGHTADAIADAFFRLTLMVRFRRRGETQLNNVTKLIEALLENRGEQAMSGFALTADRGYGKLSTLTELQRFGIHSILIMPEHLIRCHPFVAKSFLVPTRSDEEEEAAESLDAVDPSREVSVGSEQENDQGGAGNEIDTLPDISDQAPSGVTEPMQQHATTDGEDITVQSEQQNNPATEVELDRRPDFVIDDSVEEGPRAYFATKRIPIPGGRPAAYTQVTAVAVREHGTNKFCKVLRFLYNTPESTTRCIETWIAVPRTQAITHLLFCNRSDDGRITRPSCPGEDEKYQIEHLLLQRCMVLTISQQCADWFVLRQLRITGTIAGNIIMTNPNLRRLLGQDLLSTEALDPAKLLQSLSKSWFSSSRSTEAMMKGTANESAVFGAIRRKSFVQAAFECGMLARREKPWLACSPDGVALIDAESLGFNDVNHDVERLSLASIEIKTSVAVSSLDRALAVSSPEVIVCEVGDAKFVEVIPPMHIGQVMHQLYVLSVRFLIYVSASETGLLYVVVMHCSEELLQLCGEVLECSGAPVVAWAHESDPVIPSFATRSLTKELKSRLPFWSLVNDFVKTKDAFPPLKLFKHGAQSFYSKTKGGVDGTTQARSILRSSTSSLKWEQKLVSQTLKTLTVNAFVLWRMTVKQEMLESKESFHSLDRFRDSLNSIQSLADFVYDAAKELLSYADELERWSRSGPISDPEQGRSLDLSITSEEEQRLKILALNRKRKRIQFFNTEDGRKLRLHVGGHTHKYENTPKYCALCGNNVSGWRGHRTRNKCSTCTVHLCVRPIAGLRKSCWDTWHTAQQLIARSPARPTARMAVERSSPSVNDERGQSEDGGNISSRTRRRRRAESPASRSVRRRIVA